MPKVYLSFQRITERIKRIKFPEVDVVIGIATGGVVPASLVAFYLSKPLHIVGINYRDENNNPRYETPKLYANFDLPITDQDILLIDDVSVSGQTLETAKQLFGSCRITTFVLKGKADISAFPEINTCVNWPWKK